MFNFKKYGLVLSLLAGLFVVGCDTVEQPVSPKKTVDITFPTPEQSTRTQSVVSREAYDWMIRHTILAYQDNPGVTAEQDVVLFLTRICHYFTVGNGSTGAALLKEGQNLIALGNDDPLLKIWTGMLAFQEQEFDEAELLVSSGLKGLNGRGYPQIHSYFAKRCLVQIALKKGDCTTCDNDFSGQSTMLSLKAAILNGEFNENEVQIVYKLLSQSAARGDGGNTWKLFLDICGKDQGQFNPWLISMVRGKSEVFLAWESRGDGWADEVTPEGWRGFREHLTNAHAVLTKAWELHPEYPESAAVMITVAKGLGDDVTGPASLWFNRSVQSQVDYRKAYYNYLELMLPRWGGSYEKMRSFGQKCLETNRFDTDVPFYYLVVLRNIGRDLLDNKWRAPFRDAEVAEKLDVLFDGLLAEPTRKDDLDRILTQQAIVKAWQGHYSKSLELFSSLNSGVDLKKGFAGKALSYSGRSRETIHAELCAFTGPHQEPLRKADELNLSGENQQSLILFKQVLQESQVDGEVFTYLRRRIALQLMGARARVAHARTPVLHIAARRNEVDAVEFLLDHGVNADVRNENDDTALHIAPAKYDKLDSVKALLARGADINALNGIGVTPLFNACVYAKPTIAKYLIEQGADILLSNKNNFAPLHLALAYHMPGVARQLVENGADIHQVTSDQWSPLHMAIRNNHSGIALSLITKGADVNSKNGDGFTPLILAIAGNNSSLVEPLLKRGANVHIPSEKGWTALHWAAYVDAPEIADLLLRYGASTTARTDDNITPSEVAQQNGNFMLGEKLK